MTPAERERLAQAARDAGETFGQFLVEAGLARTGGSYDTHAIELLGTFLGVPVFGQRPDDSTDKQWSEWKSRLSALLSSR